MSFHHNTIEKSINQVHPIGMSRRDIAEKEEIIRWQEKLLKRSYTRNLQKRK